MKRILLMCLDTETCTYDPSIEVVRGSNSLTYHIGYSIFSPRDGKVFVERSHLVSEIFIGESRRMKSAYYADKIPQYMKDLRDGVHDCISFFAIMNEINALCAEYDVTAIVAHNAAFDVAAINRTAGYLADRFVQQALPFPKIEIWDSMKMAAPLVATKRYQTFCNSNGYLTSQGRPRRTAEILYRYISKNNDFIEAHTALEDVRIERKIILRTYRTAKEEDRATYRLNIKMQDG